MWLTSWWRVCYQRGLTRLVYNLNLCFRLGNFVFIGDGFRIKLCSQKMDFRFHKIDVYTRETSTLIILKEDGVGPVDNRPSTDWLHHFILTNKKDM